MHQNKYRLQKTISRLTLIWMLVISFLIILIAKYTDDDQQQFYHFGPSNKLIILGFKINTELKYIAVITYCFINSIFRTLYNSILHSWVINNIQDETKEKPIELRGFAYEITLVTTIYAWFDWFIYINVLLSQIDMILVEISADLIVSIITTTYYLRTYHQNQQESLSLLNSI